MPKAAPTAGVTLLAPNNHMPVMIDHQAQMAFIAKSIDACLEKQRRAGRQSGARPRCNLRWNFSAIRRAESPATRRRPFQ